MRSMLARSPGMNRPVEASSRRDWMWGGVSESADCVQTPAPGPRASPDNVRPPDSAPPSPPASPCAEIRPKHPEKRHPRSGSSRPRSQEHRPRSERNRQNPRSAARAPALPATLLGAPSTLPRAPPALSGAPSALHGAPCALPVKWPGTRESGQNPGILADFPGFQAKSRGWEPQSRSSRAHSHGPRRVSKDGPRPGKFVGRGGSCAF